MATKRLGGRRLQFVIDIKATPISASAAADLAPCQLPCFLYIVNTFSLEYISMTVYFHYNIDNYTHFLHHSLINKTKITIKKNVQAQVLSQYGNKAAALGLAAAGMPPLMLLPYLESLRTMQQQQQQQQSQQHPAASFPNPQSLSNGPTSFGALHPAALAQMSPSTFLGSSPPVVSSSSSSSSSAASKTPALVPTTLVIIF